MAATVEHSTYLKQIFADGKTLKHTVKTACRRIRAYEKKNEITIDAIVACGVSGTTVASAVAYELGKQLTIVRKEDVDSHAEKNIEGILTHRHRYVIIDDFVSTGATMEFIVNRMPTFAICEGAYLFADGRQRVYTSETLANMVFPGYRDAIYTVSRLARAVNCIPKKKIKYKINGQTYTGY